MPVKLLLQKSPPGAILPLFPVSDEHFQNRGICIIENNEKILELNSPEIGSGFYPENNLDAPLLKIVGYTWIPSTPKAIYLPLLMACREIYSSELASLIVKKNGYSLAAITLSDKGAQGNREDKSGPLIVKKISETISICWSQNYILPDDKFRLRGLLAELALEQKYNIICTTGGTGLGQRDFTPQAAAPLLDVVLPGFSQAMMRSSLDKTPYAIISRATAGLIGKCLMINLPGSTKAVEENLDAILPGLNHALAKINGDTADCGG